MIKDLQKSLLFVLLGVLVSCQSKEEVIFDSTFDPEKEIAEEVQMIFSDSARLKFIIRTPKLVKYKEKGITVEEFPNGIDISFYNNEEKISSTMHAKYAERRSAEGILLLRDSVVLTNNSNDELTTSAILWSEKDHSLVTNKLVKLIKGDSQDTLYGIGMNAKDDFTRFQIKKFTGRRHLGHEFQ